jgi:hypothetical protein
MLLIIANDAFLIDTDADMYLQIPMVIVFPIEVERSVRTRQEGQKTWSGYLQYVDKKDQSIPLKSLPVVLAYNGTNHYSPCLANCLVKVNKLYRNISVVLEEGILDCKKLHSCMPVGPMKELIGQVSQGLDTAATCLGCVDLATGTAAAAGAALAAGNLPTSPVPGSSGEPSSASKRRKLSSESGDPAQDEVSESGAPGTESGAVAGVHTLPPKSTKSANNQCACGTQCVDLDDYITHLKVHDGGNWSCSYMNCEGVFASSRATWKHFRTVHLGIFLHNCPEPNCKYGSEESTIVKKHREKVHQNFKSDVICEDCNKSFSTHKGLASHNCLSEDKKFMCKHPLEDGSECTKRYTTARRLREHTAIAHSVNPPAPHLCPVCGKTFSSKTSLKAHRVRKHPDQEEERGEHEHENA